MKSRNLQAISPLDRDLRIVARSGAIVDTSGDRWLLGADQVLNSARWSEFPEIREPMLAYLRNLVRTVAPDYVVSQASYLAKMLTAPDLRAAITRDLAQDGFITARIFGVFRRALQADVSPGQQGSYLVAFRRWYLWCLDADVEGFDEDVGVMLEDIVIASNPKGQAVLRHDPDAGPLTVSEFDDFSAALRAATAAKSLPLEKLLVAWLSLCFGTNARNMLLLNEEDLIVTDLGTEQRFFEIRLPRIKKRTVLPRSQFRTRQLAANVGNLFLEVIEQNQRRDQGANATPPAGKRPLFRADEARDHLLGTPFEEDRFRTPRFWVTNALKEVVGALNVRSRTGAPLKISARRMRYTFATRLVQEGCSPLELADALDHSSTDHVMVYFNARLEAVEALDAALAKTLTPFAQKCGQIVRSENEAVRGDDPRNSRIYRTDVTSKRQTGVGTCGSYAWCHLMAPIACYTCLDFQPWLDGPHEEIMEDLLEERRRKLALGADVKWTSIHDETIKAIAKIVERCTEMKRKDAA